MGKFVSLFFILILVLVLSIGSCKPDAEPQTVKKEITINIKAMYGADELHMLQTYIDPLGHEMWLTTDKFYLSNITLIRDNGDKSLVSDIAIIDISNSNTLSISGSVPVGNYTAISMDLGVREDLNMADPATYPVDHPLSVAQNMYWSWSTQYIFSKSEGKVIRDQDTLSWFIHAGLQSLYRPDILIARNFSVGDNTNIQEITMDFRKALNGPVVIDLAENGQSHTTDNLPLAVTFMDNFSLAFN